MAVDVSTVEAKWSKANSDDQDSRKIGINEYDYYRGTNKPKVIS